MSYRNPYDKYLLLRLLLIVPASNFSSVKDHQS